MLLSDSESESCISRYVLLGARRLSNCKSLSTVTASTPLESLKLVLRCLAAEAREEYCECGCGAQLRALLLSLPFPFA